MPVMGVRFVDGFIKKGKEKSILRQYRHSSCHTLVRADIIVPFQQDTLSDAVTPYYHHNDAGEFNSILVLVTTKNVDLVNTAINNNT